MPYYKYLARSKDGKSVEDFTEAQNDDELIGILQAQGLTVITFKAFEKKKAKIETKKHKMHYRVRLDDLIVFSRQLTALLGAGITLLRSLDIIVTQVESRRLYDVLAAVKKDISAGSSLKAAIAKHPLIFSNLWINIIETGETTGQLSFALQQLTSYLESAAALQRKIKTALFYPAIVLCVATLAVVVFIVKIIPMFHNIYSDFGSRLPLFTQMIFSVCLGIKRFLILIAVLIGVLIYGIIYYGRTVEGRKHLDTIKLTLPLFGNIIREISAVRFASGLSMLIKSGTPILHALDIVTETSGNVVIKEMLQEVKQNVREGKSMAEPLLAGGIFPDMLAHMVAVGEESGELADILEDAAKFYNERVDAIVTRLANIFEPLLIVVIGAIVGTLVIAMFLPIFGLSGALK